MSPGILSCLASQGFTSLTLQTGATALAVTDISAGDVTVETYQYKPSLAEVRSGQESD